MANLPEDPDVWPAGVYKLERTDAADAGANGEGPLNLATVSLTGRTAYLKQESDRAWAMVEAVIAGEIGGFDKAVPAQLYAAIQNAIAEAIAAIPAVESVPVGTILICPADAPLPGTLALNGGLPLRATYPDLWAYAQASNNLVAEINWAAGRWGAFSDGDGATTFRLPDYRGEGLRFWDAARGIDIGRLLSDWQAGQMENHNHSFNYDIRTTGADGGWTAEFEAVAPRYGSSAVDSTSILATGLSENLMRNVAAHACVKY